MKKELIFFLTLMVILGIGSRAWALETTWPPSPLGTALTDSSTLTDMVKYFYEWGIFIGGIAVFISLVFGGFLYLTSAGNPGRMTEAKDRIFSALIGLVLLFSIYVILNTINPELTILSTPSMGPTCDTNADCLCKGGKCGGVGSACTTDADCPYTCSDCLTPPSPNPKCGDGNPEGICMIQVSTGCDTDNDCPEPQPDPDPADKNYICKDDPNPGDGIKEGNCSVRCIEVIFYENTNFAGNSCKTIPINCFPFVLMAGCVGKQPVRSIDIKGTCVVYLYSNDNITCQPTATDTIVISNDTRNLQLDYETTLEEFDAVKIREISF